MKKLMLLALLVFVFPTWAGAADTTITWDANSEPYLAGYNVYQADRMGNLTGAWVKVASGVTEVTYVVTGLDSGNNYAWLVTAVDNSGNESFVSNMVELQDRTPPMAVENLR